MSGNPHGARILYVGDDERDPKQLTSKVDRGGVDVVPDADTAIDRVEERAYDCLVCEYDLDETTGIGLASSVDEEAPTLPVVLAPTAGSEAIAGEAVSAPVTAYVPADGDGRRAERLTETVESVVEDERTVPDRRRLLAAIDTAAEGIALLDGDGHYEYVNEAYADLYGYEPDELVGRHKGVVYPDGRSFGDLVSDVRERSELQRGAEFVRADGSTVWVEHAISTVGDGYVCTSRDVTERRRRQEELERRSSLLDSLFDQIPAHLYIKDEEGRHLRVSRYFMEREQVDEDAMSIPAYDRDHVVGKTDLEINDSEHSRRAHEDDMRVIESGEPILNKEEYVADDDAWNLTSKVPWQDEDGDVRGLIGISQRITHQKAVEAELERKNERLSEFASLVSHDLRNPLQTARGRTEILQRRYDDDNLSVIERAHDRMETLIDDILTLARGSEASTDEEPVDLAALVDECWDRLGAEDASLVVDTDRTVAADRTRLTQLMENLLQNAVDHGGDSVTVTVGDLPDGGFYVEDDGPGISPADRDDVFEAGYSTAETGTGFGLRIVEQVAEEHGWTVNLSEDRDGGTRFEIADDSSGDARHGE